MTAAVKCCRKGTQSRLQPVLLCPRSSIPGGGSGPKNFEKFPWPRKRTNCTALGPPAAAHAPVAAAAAAGRGGAAAAPSPRVAAAAPAPGPALPLPPPGCRARPPPWKHNTQVSSAKRNGSSTVSAPAPGPALPPLGCRVAGHVHRLVRPNRSSSSRVAEQYVGRSMCIKQKRRAWAGSSRRRRIGRRCAKP